MSLAGVLVIGVLTGILAYLVYGRDFKRSGKDIKIQLPRMFKPTVMEEIEEKPRHAKRIPSAPLSGLCGLCGNRITMPFRCKYCKGLYCEEHRLPENHDCEKLGKR